MDVIKKEMEMDPLSPEIDEAIREEDVLHMKGSTLKVEVDEIKMESSELICDFTSDIKCEENEVPVAFPVLKSEIEGQWSDVDAVKEDLLPDTTEDDIELTYRPVHEHCKGDIGDQEIDASDKSLNHSNHPQTHIKQPHEDCGSGDTPSSEEKLKFEFFIENLIAAQLVKENKLNDLGERVLKCSKTYAQTDDLIMHTATHMNTKTFKCDICEKCFVRKGHLMNHISTHAEDKTFKCDICGKCFRQKQYLINHISTHTGDKTFKCNFCDMYFRQKQHLKNHSLTHTNLKPFKCDICDKSFARIDYLTKHVLTHTGVKAFKCDICDRSLSDKRGLENHRRAHTDDKPFKCNICEKSFVGLIHLRRHTLLHGIKKPFECDKCEKSFSWLDCFRKHAFTYTQHKHTK